MPPILHPAGPKNAISAGGFGHFGGLKNAIRRPTLHRSCPGPALSHLCQALETLEYTFLSCFVPHDDHPDERDGLDNFGYILFLVGSELATLAEI